MAAECAINGIDISLSMAPAFPNADIAVLTRSLTSESFASVSTLSLITPIFVPLISPVSSDA